MTTLWILASLSSSLAIELHNAGFLGQDLKLPDWLPRVAIDDFDCRRTAVNAIDLSDIASEQPGVTKFLWKSVRDGLGDLLGHLVDPSTVSLVVEDRIDASWHRAKTLDIFQYLLPILWHFREAFMQCPIGAVTASIFAACLAHLPENSFVTGNLILAHRAVLDDLRQTQFMDLLVRDIGLLVSVAPLQTITASNWRPFSVLVAYFDEAQKVLTTTPWKKYDDKCDTAFVVGLPILETLNLIRNAFPSASQTSFEGLHFLNRVKPLVEALIEDPNDSILELHSTCPVAAVAIACVAACFSLMVSPHFFEKFVLIAKISLLERTKHVLERAAQWSIFQILAKMGTLATRGFDLDWSMHDLFPLPSDSSAFDALRLDPVARDSRLAAFAVSHSRTESRRLAAFLWYSSAGWGDPLRYSPLESFVYVTVAGGSPYADYIGGFVRRAIEVSIPALVICCLDMSALSACEESLAAGRGGSRIHCMRSFDGSAALVKHAIVATLLSAAVDVVWLDFDTFILQNPTSAIMTTRDNPERILPTCSQVQYGPFLFENASDVCSVTQVCETEGAFPQNLFSSKAVCNEPDAVDLLVTEHWGARCINSGLFYARAGHRSLSWFIVLLAELHANPYVDNQNLFDTFLGHSTVFAPIPSELPRLRYALLDIESRFASLEGHIGSVEDLVTFHFWSSDATLVTLTHKAMQPSLKPSRGKADLFDLFFNTVGEFESSSALRSPIAEPVLRFIEQVRSSASPTWKGMCAVSPFGVFSFDLSRRL